MNDPWNLNYWQARHVHGLVRECNAALDRLPAARRKLAIWRLIERIDVDDARAVMHVVLPEWAKEAFAQVTSALTYCAVSTMPPVRFELTRPKA